MSNLRRFDPEGKPVFITNVTYDRAPILIENIDLVMAAFRHARHHTRELLAWVVMPEHIHALFTSKSQGMSYVMKSFKQKFGALYRSRYGLRKGRVWQHRFWDHIIRHQEDFNRHVDYIHLNPVKHSFCNSPGAYDYSSYARWRASGLYEPDWAVLEESEDGSEFGE